MPHHHILAVLEPFWGGGGPIPHFGSHCIGINFLSTMKMNWQLFWQLITSIGQIFVSMIVCLMLEWEHADGCCSLCEDVWSHCKTLSSVFSTGQHSLISAFKREYFLVSDSKLLIFWTKQGTRTTPLDVRKAPFSDIYIDQTTNQ